MRSYRIYTAQTLHKGDVCTLDEHAAHHVRAVLRSRAGAQVVLFNGEGGEFDATLTRVDRRCVEAKLDSYRDIERESPLAVHLLQGLSRTERMDLAIQKAVELGVTSIRPVATERSVVKLEPRRAERRVKHWRQIAIHACEQSGRTRVPTVFDIATLTDTLATPAQGHALMLSPGAQTPLVEFAYNGGPIHLLIGPEGGLSPDERAQASALHYTPVSLGPRVLRTETATLTTLALLQATWGDLREPQGERVD